MLDSEYVYMLKRLCTWPGKGNLNYLAIIFIYPVENNIICKVFLQTFLALGNTRSAFFDIEIFICNECLKGKSKARCIFILQGIKVSAFSTVCAYIRKAYGSLIYTVGVEFLVSPKNYILFLTPRQYKF